MRRFILGSTSVHKLEAVRSACVKLGIDAVVSAVGVDSGQNEQPVGFEETLEGALARASFAKSCGEGDSIYVGVESGIINLSRSSTIDLAVIVVLAGDRRIVTTSAGIEFPQECVSIAHQRGFKTTTVGSIIAEKLGGDATDPHFTLTKGMVSRKSTLVQALMLALSQL